jgi:hypothetical protein
VFEAFAHFLQFGPIVGGGAPGGYVINAETVFLYNNSEFLLTFECEEKQHF